MAKFIVPDPDIISSVEPQQVGALGVFPAALAELEGSESDWRKRIKDANAPLKIVDRTPSHLQAAEEGTAIEAAVKEAKS